MYTAHRVGSAILKFLEPIPYWLVAGRTVKNCLWLTVTGFHGTGVVTKFDCQS